MDHRAIALIALAAAAACSTPDVQQQTVQSKAVGRPFTIFTWFPPGDRDTDARYPVLYLLDADQQMDWTVTELAELIEDGKLSPIIVVGIGYGDETNRRATDFTPTSSDAEPVGGGAEAFLSFLTAELIPKIDGELRTVPDRSARALAGHSYGGLFTTFALFQGTEAFGRFLPASPSLWYDDGRIFSYERGYAEAHADLALPARVYTTMGRGGDGVIMMIYFDEMLERLGQYQGLDLESRVLEGDYHGDSWKDAYPGGIRALFADWRAP